MMSRFIFSHTFVNDRISAAINLNKKMRDKKNKAEMLPQKMRCMDFMQETTLPIQMERQALFIKPEARLVR